MSTYTCAKMWCRCLHFKILGCQFLIFIDDVFLSKLNVSPLVSLMKPVDVNPNDEWVNVSKHSPMQ